MKWLSNCSGYFSFVSLWRADVFAQAAGLFLLSAYHCKFFSRFLMPSNRKKASEFWVILKYRYFQCFHCKEPYHFKDSDTILETMDLFLGTLALELLAYNPKDLRLPIFLQDDVRAHIS